MHILAIQDGAIDTGDDAVDLDQEPGDIVVLSSADTELGLLARAYACWAPSRTETPKPSLRLANVLRLRHNYSVDLYVEKTLSKAKLVVVRALGGRSYWPYGLEQIASHCKSAETNCAILPGDGNPDASLFGLSTIPPYALLYLWQALVEGGPDNAHAFLETAHALIDDRCLPSSPILTLPKSGRLAHRPLPAAAKRQASGRAALIIYRALFQAGDLAPLNALANALAARGLKVDPHYVTSLRDADVIRDLTHAFAAQPPDIVLNATAFATGNVETADTAATVGAATMMGSDAPWLQVVFSGDSRETWLQRASGLSMRDIAMHVAMPEFDGRILSRAVAFKRDRGRDALTQAHISELSPDPERIAFVAELAANWVRLRKTPPGDRRVALILPNYPNRDSRLANGVGLDTPQSTVGILNALKSEGYRIEALPTDATDLMRRLRAGPTNAPRKLDQRAGEIALPIAQYRSLFSQLPEPVRTAINERWGEPAEDPFASGDALVLPFHAMGNIVIGIQPARGYNIDPKGTYHDPALVPPHGYVATYLWLRHVFGTHAIVNIGKHGNLEWLPGKALALSSCCYPDAILGPTPTIYPFIVNDPGEGAQAKRRTAAVVIDHLMPPMTRADTYGALSELETLLDEYYDALSLDPRRAEKLKVDIVRTAERSGLSADCGLASNDTEPEKLQKLDAYLCDLKELQIRGGLHVFGRSPDSDLRIDLLSALVRVPRGDAPSDASLQRALSADLSLGDFDPLDCDGSTPWTGPRPALLAGQTDTPWRTAGDTVERLERLACGLIADLPALPSNLPAATQVLGNLRDRIAPALDASGDRERSALIAALDGRLIAPGPSGAATRGRPDVLPTGRNFFAIDSRTLPTRTAYDLGRRSAEALIERYVADHGDWPRAVTLSAWGTANMRTGGDDLAQALALMGARPTWDGASGRVTGFDILPIAQLGRPRVDVTLRISGFFRDAFPQQIALIDSAVCAVANLDEPAQDNPLAARTRTEASAGVAAGLSETTARRAATFRIFGAQPGAYGAGLQAMFDERIWESERDLADAFLVWGAFAYGSDSYGSANRDALEMRLRASDAIIHNQDNREHDILDSDDYYQFAGGLAVAARVLKGQAVPVYHGDHARPEKPVIRSLDEEIARVVRARAVNPKWITAMMRHGYKGAFEMAATVDYLFAFAVTTNAVRDHHFDLVFDAYIADTDVRAFLLEHNAEALADIAERLREAIDRSIWQPSRNSAHALLSELATQAVHNANEARETTP